MSPRPVLSLLDGHSAHHCLDTMKMAAEQPVIMFALPPNTTHLLNLLPLYCKKMTIFQDHFNVLKQPLWTCFDFFSTLQSMTILSGFIVTGIYLLNHNVLLNPITESFHVLKPTYMGIDFNTVLSPYNLKCAVSLIDPIKQSKEARAPEQNLDLKDVVHFNQWFKRGIFVKHNQASGLRSTIPLQKQPHVCVYPIQMSTVRKFTKVPARCQQLLLNLSPVTKSWQAEKILN